MQMSLAGPGLPFELFPFLLSDSICCIIARLLPSVLTQLIITFLSEPFSQKGRKRAHLSVTKLLLLLPAPLPSFAGIDLPLLSVAEKEKEKEKELLMMNDHWRIRICAVGAAAAVDYWQWRK